MSAPEGPRGGASVVGYRPVHRGSPRALRYVVLAADASELGRFDTGEEMLTEVVDALGSWVAIADATDSKITGGTLDPKRPHEFMVRGNGIEDRAAWEVVRRWVASNPARLTFDEWYARQPKPKGSLQLICPHCARRIDAAIEGHK